MNHDTNATAHDATPTPGANDALAGHAESILAQMRNFLENTNSLQEFDTFETGSMWRLIRELSRIIDAQTELAAATKPSFDVPHKRTNQARTDAKKLTNPRERKIMKKIIDAGGWLSEGMLNKSERELCGKRPDLYHRENYGGRPGYAVTEIGRAALDALADATPDGGAK